MSAWNTVVLPAVVAAAVAVAGNYWSYLGRDRELDIKMLEIALGVLREKPQDSELTAVRSWAVDIIDQYSGVKLSPEARSELLQRQLEFSFVPWSESKFRSLLDEAGRQSRAGVSSDPELLSPALPVPERETGEQR